LDDLLWFFAFNWQHASNRRQQPGGIDRWAYRSSVETIDEFEGEITSLPQQV
jgi:hypothetical protein